MNCPKCNELIAPDMKFCIYCGVTLQLTPAQAGPSKISERLGKWFQSASCFILMHVAWTLVLVMCQGLLALGLSLADGDIYWLVVLLGFCGILFAVCSPFFVMKIAFEITSGHWPRKWGPIEIAFALLHLAISLAELWPTALLVGQFFPGVPTPYQVVWQTFIDIWSSVIRGASYFTGSAGSSGSRP